jgi:phospholipid/cholesterol/gamma-HCH transport system substrate-binding protein
MLTASVRVKLLAFLVIGVLVIVYIGLKYAGLGDLVGLRGYYRVDLNLSASGGIFPDAEVTYRGVPVGRVGPMDLTGSGISVELDIDNSAPAIPAAVRAVVADRSAVGEEYVDLRPTTGGGPVLAEGSSIQQRDTQLPPPVTGVLGNVDALAASVPEQSLRTVVDQLYQATNGQGQNLQTLLDTANSLTAAAAQDLPQTSDLIQDSQTVLATQASESGALTAFGQNAQALAAQLDRSDGDLRRLIAVAPGAAQQLDGLLTDTDPQLSVLLANLTTTSEVFATRTSALTELLSVAPSAVAAGSSAVHDGSANISITTTFFNPLPCTDGYDTTGYRNGLDTSPAPPLNTAAQCLLPASSGVDVRGAANAPSGGGVPAPVQPGTLGTAGPALPGAAAGAALPGALGLPALPSHASGLSSLLGLGDS